MMAAHGNEIAKLVDDLYICPITQECMQDPVIAADGHTYERAAIEKWLANNTTSPMTGLVLDHSYLTPNYMVKSLIAGLTELKAEQDKVTLKAKQGGKQSSAVLPAGGSNDYSEIDLNRLRNNLQRFPEVCIYNPSNHTFSFLVNGMPTVSSDPLAFVSLRIPHSLTRNPTPTPSPTSVPKPTPTLTPVPSPTPWPMPTPRPSPTSWSSPTPTPEHSYNYEDARALDLFIQGTLSIIAHVLLSSPHSASPISEDDVFSEDEESSLNYNAYYPYDIESDERFERSDKPGVIYEVYSRTKISDAVLIAYKIDPLQCVRGRGDLGIYHITIYDSKETAEAARLSLGAMRVEEESRVVLASSRYQFHGLPPQTSAAPVADSPSKSSATSLFQRCVLL